MNEVVDAVGREILERYFPDAEQSKIHGHATWLSPPYVTRVSEYRFIKEGADLSKLLDDFHRGIHAAWKAYNAIPLHVRSADNSFEWAHFAKVTRAVTGLPVHRGQRQIQPQAIRSMRQAAQHLTKLSAQAMAADNPAKVCLVQHARNAWLSLSGTEPPVMPSPGSPFLHFVEDVIDGAGKKWSAEATLKVWQRAMEKIET